MDTSFNWHQLRGLGALAALGIFLVYVCFVGWRQKQAAGGIAGGRLGVQP